ncbi:MAG: iron-containing alcohol dehydrogenase [Candidatus Hydrogenedentes bacterium]|nr:iron-containing alcohol dehydrogenase [Candidatus Hydrogenedentota bacterium]
MAIVQYNYPTIIKFGPGAVALAADAIKSRGLSRPLVLTDTGVAPLPFFQKIVDSLNAAGLMAGAFSSVYGNPVKSQVSAGVKVYHDHHADSLVIVGGGAALDVGKVVALMVHHPGDLFDYEDDKPGGLPVDREIPFMIAVPTTAGTGSEVGRSSVISDDVTHIKRIIFSPRLLPPLVLSDPELTVGLPASVTASTGVDALSHNVEAYLSKGFHPLADGIALQGIKLVAQNLETCIKEPGNLDARGKMLMASSMGATAFQKGLGVTHSCAHALSAVCDLHHGLAISIMMPACMRFNAAVAGDRLADMTHAAGATGDFAAWLEELQTRVGLPLKLSAAGVTPEHLDKLVEIAVNDVCHPCNPRPVSAADFRALFEAAL